MAGLYWRLWYPVVMDDIRTNCTAKPDSTVVYPLGSEEAVIGWISEITGESADTVYYGCGRSMTARVSMNSGVLPRRALKDTHGAVDLKIFITGPMLFSMNWRCGTATG